MQNQYHARNIGVNRMYYLIPFKVQQQNFYLVKSVFHMCCKDWLGTDNFLRTLRRCLLLDKYRQVVGGENAVAIMPQQLSTSKP
jgi:hypothetical protein